jgi:hypothetical protein
MGQATDALKDFIDTIPDAKLQVYVIKMEQSTKT